MANNLSPLIRGDPLLRGFVRLCDYLRPREATTQLTQRSNEVLRYLDAVRRTARPRLLHRHLCGPLQPDGHHELPSTIPPRGHLPCSFHAVLTRHGHQHMLRTSSGAGAWHARSVTPEPANVCCRGGVAYSSHYRAGVGPPGDMRFQDELSIR